MGIVVNKNSSEKSAIQARIDADLRARVAESSANHNNDIDHSDYLANTKKTGRFGWIWLVLIIGAIISIILMIMI